MSTQTVWAHVIVMCVAYASVAVTAETFGPKPPPVTIHVHTARDPSGIVSEEEQQRIDSVKDIETAIRRYREVTLVQDRERAMLVLEVLRREKRPNGSTAGSVALPARRTLSGRLPSSIRCSTCA